MCKPYSYNKCLISVKCVYSKVYVNSFSLYIEEPVNITRRSKCRNICILVFKYSKIKNLFKIIKNPFLNSSWSEVVTPNYQNA